MPWAAGVPAASGGNDSNRGFGLLCDLKTGEDWKQERLRKHDHLGTEDQPGTEADLQCKAAAELRVFQQQAVGGEGDGGSGGVAGVGDVPRDDDVLREF